MKILVDDAYSIIRDSDEIPDIIVRNYDTAIAVGWGFYTNNDVYLDYDLGGDKTGYDWIVKLEEFVHGPFIKWGLWLPSSITCVSANPIGRRHIQQVIDRLYKEK